jgi:hypothetical protein
LSISIILPIEKPGRHRKDPGQNRYTLDESKPISGVSWLLHAQSTAKARRKPEMRVRCPFKPQTCNWCGKPFGKDEACWLVRGLKNSMELPSEEEGPFISLYLPSVNKEVIALLRSPSFDARKDRVDFTVATCSEECARRLTAVLKEDMAETKVI